MKGLAKVAVVRASKSSGGSRRLGSRLVPSGSCEPHVADPSELEVQEPPISDAICAWFSLTSSTWTEKTCSQCPTTPVDLC